MLTLAERMKNKIFVLLRRQTRNIADLDEEDRKGKVGGVSGGKGVRQHGGGEVQTCKAKNLQSNKE